VSIGSLVHQLRRARYQLIVDFQGYGETALLAWIARAPRRWGGVQKKARRHCYTHLCPLSPSAHPIDGHLQLLHSGGLDLWEVRNEWVLADHSLDEARRFLVDSGWTPGKPLVFIQPFTSSAQKNWPLASCMVLARRFRQQGAHIVLGGGPADRSLLLSSLGAEFPISAGLDLLTHAALTQLSTLVIGGDTGLLHLAVALQKRVVMIMGYNHPGSTIPYLHADWTIIPQPGGHLADISVAQVAAAVNQALTELGSGLSI
jgi:ADP-heptose:LPS heptosyltransferase